MTIPDELGLFGNHFSFETLYKWIQDSTDYSQTFITTSSCIILMGAPGIGKTYSVIQMCKHLGITLKKIDSMNCHSGKELNDLILKMTTTHLEDTLMQQVSKKLLFIDEFEILVQLDRNIPSILYNRLMGINSRQLPYMPVIIACNTNMEKRLGEMKRMWQCIQLKLPTEAEIILMLRQHHTNVRADILLHIAEKANGNIQQALQMIQYELYKDSKEDTNTNDIVNHDYIHSIDTTPNIDVLYHNPPSNIARQLFREDMWMNPLRFHENLAMEFEFRKGTKHNKTKVYSNILKCMIEWDIMSGADNAEGCLADIATDHLSSAPSHILASLPKKKRGNETTLADFTKTLSQMSLQKKMERHTYQDDFPWKHIGSYHYTLTKNKTKI